MNSPPSLLVPPAEPMLLETLPIQILQLPGAEDLPLPAYKTDGAAGMDLYASIVEPLTLAPGARAAVPTGISIAVPPGYEAQVRARSGLALRYGIALVNAPGTIDSDYRGEIAVLMVNLGSEPFAITRGERIAQVVVAPVIRVHWEPVATLDELGATVRGAGGFGHTGN